MRCWPALFAFVLPCLASRVQGEDLKVLIGQYNTAREKIGGLLKERADKVQEKVAPVLKKIGEVDNDESLAFLIRELETASLPEIQAACAEPVSVSTNPKALSFLIKAFSRRQKTVCIAILEALAKTKKDLSPEESGILQMAQSAPDIEVKKHLPPVLGKLDTPQAAKSMLGLVQWAKGAKADADQGALNEASFTALKAAKNQDVKKWLGGGAFDSAQSDPARLLLVTRLAGELALQDARGRLEKLLPHSSSEIASAALASLNRLGLGSSSVDGIISALEKHKGNLAFQIQALDALARTGTDRALEVITRFASGGEPEIRAVAMGSLALLKDNLKAQKALLDRLQDSDAGTRAAALKVLSRIREKSMIEPLISFLGRETEEKLKVNALELLVKLTGQNMGLVEADWRKWWEISRDRFELPKERPSGITIGKTYDLSYFGIEVSSKKLGFLVDISGSMNEPVPVKISAGNDKDGNEEKGKTVVVKGGEEGKGGGKEGGGGRGSPPKDGKAKKIEVLKRELTRVIKKLPSDTQINILTFNKTFKAWQPELQSLSGSGRSKAIQFVEGLQTSPGTNVFDTLEFALKDKRVDTIYLLTDGLPADGKIKEPKAICTEVMKQNRLRGVTIHCVAFGEESQFLKELAAQNGGEYRFVDRY